MIKDLLNQLKKVLPKQTDEFTTSLDVSLTRSGSVVTGTTTAAHGLKPNDYVVMNGAKTPILIDSLTRIGNYAIALTNTPHSLVSDYTVEISGADQSDYNGIKDIIQPPTFNIQSITISGTTATVITTENCGYIADPRFEAEISGVKQDTYNTIITPITILSPNSFTCEIIGTDESAEPAFGKVMKIKQKLNNQSFVFTVLNNPAPATGTIYQLKTYQEGYNGYKKLLTASGTSFTYAIDTTPLNPQGTIKMKFNPMIFSAPDLDVVIEDLKTLDPRNKMFVILNNGTASRDKAISTDEIYSVNTGVATRIILMKLFDIYVVLKSEDQKYYADSIEKANKLQAPLCKSLAGFQPTSPFTDQKYSGIFMSSEGYSGRNGQYYIHRYSFDTKNIIVNEDQVDIADAVPFRQFNADLNDADGEVMAEVRAEIDQ